MDIRKYILWYDVIKWENLTTWKLKLIGFIFLIPINLASLYLLVYGLWNLYSQNFIIGIISIIPAGYLYQLHFKELNDKTINRGDSD